ncbi:MAG: hypothetical protein U5J78_05940 [Parasphingorhabdus sp.]|nr:hypothetical protein [Parasphingorhabdus sp.]
MTPFNAATLNGVSFNGIQLTRPGFFQTTSYIGAVRDANDTWYQGWTCNSATADLGPNNSSCLSLPTT